VSSADVLGLALALSMDAVAIALALAVGFTVRRTSAHRSIRMGAFQAATLARGWATGRAQCGQIVHPSTAGFRRLGADHPEGHAGGVGSG